MRQVHVVGSDAVARHIQESGDGLMPCCISRQLFNEPRVTKQHDVEIGIRDSLRKKRPDRAAWLPEGHFGRDFEK